MDQLREKVREVAAGMQKLNVTMSAPLRTTVDGIGVEISIGSYIRVKASPTEYDWHDGPLFPEIVIPNKWL